MKELDLARKLTIKQRKFVKYYLETGNASRSALRAGYKHRESGYENVSKPLISRLFQELLEESGITAKEIAKVLKEGLNSTKVLGYLNNKVNGTEKVSDEFVETPDYSVRHKYLVLAMEALGYIKDNGLKVDQSKHTHITFQDIKVEQMTTSELVDSLNNRFSKQFSKE